MERRSQKQFSLVELLVVTNVIIILIAMLIPAVIRSRESAKRIKCLSNLKQLDLALQSYVLDNDSWYPVSFNLLVKGGHASEVRLFKCPSAEDEPTINGNQEVVNPSYHYLGDHADVDEISVAATGGATSMVADKASNHGEYGNVLFSGGHVIAIPGVRWYEDAEITTQMNELIDPN